MQNYSKESETMPSEQESSLTREPSQSEEPLMSITDVLQWKAPEKFPDVTDEEQAVIDFAATNKDVYHKWKDDPTAGNLYNVVSSLKPTIQSVIASLGGNSPNIASKARVLAAKAIQTYDESVGVSLPTWVSQNLRQLSRDIRKSNSDIQIPEGVQLDAYSIFKAEQELADELGREPTVGEIANRAHLSIKRIQDVRRKNKKQGTESGSVGEDGQSTVVQNVTDYTDEALRYVYEDSDMKDQKIIEYTTGFGGGQVLGSNDIMRKLKLTPVQLTRRKMRLSKRIMEIKDALEQV